MSKKSAGERLEFYDFSDVTVEHLHRYAIANDFVSGKIVLDIASGEGYGSFLLSKLASNVIGVDIDNESIERAKIKYKRHNLIFLQGRADEIPIESSSIDVVVSFETIEHHDKHHEMLIEIKRVLKKDGILIMSSPDKKYYSDIPKSVNPFHVKELYFNEFKNLINNYFSFANYLFQKSFNLNSFIGKTETFCNHKVYFGDETYLNKDTVNPVYNLVIASDIKSYTIEDSFFDGSEISKRLFERSKSILIGKLKNILTEKLKNTNTFKVGAFIVYPFFILKKYFKRI